MKRRKWLSDMRRREIAIIFSMTILLVLLCWGIYGRYSMQADYEDEIEYVIGVSQANMRESWRLALIQELEVEAQKYENIRIITTDAT